MPDSPARLRAPRHPDRASQAKLTLAELDAAVGRFIREVYNLRTHSETKTLPRARWEAGGFIPRMPDSLEQLDLLLTVAKPRVIHTDGIHFPSLRYLDPVLAFYIREQATIRYDPRDITEIRVYLRLSDGAEEFLCRAICPELSGATVSLKEITAARNARREQLRGHLTSRDAVIDRLLAAHTESLPALRVAGSLVTNQVRAYDLLRMFGREGQEDQLSSLGLVLNAVVPWTTRYLDAAVTQLRAHPLRDPASADEEDKDC